MGEVISLNSKKNNEEELDISLRDTIIDSLSKLGKNDLDCGIVLLMGKNGQAFSGYFNTSFKDEAVLAKVLEIDTHNRQYAREIEDND